MHMYMIFLCGFKNKQRCRCLEIINQLDVWHTAPVVIRHFKNCITYSIEQWLVKYCSYESERTNLC